MIQRPVFPSRFRVEIVAGEGVFLLSEDGHHALTGRLYERVAPFLDGRHAPDDIADRLEGSHSAAEVYYTLSVLEKKGVLQEAGPENPPPGREVPAPHGPGSSGETIRRPGVEIATLGGVSAGPLLAALDAAGIGAAGNAALRVVLTDDYLRSGLVECNEAALREGRPWLAVKPVGREALVGPLFVPGRTGCWRCLRDRHILHRATELFVMEQQGRDDPFPLPLEHTPATVRAACAMAAREIGRWVETGGNPDLIGRVISLDTRTGEKRAHVLDRNPRCPACGRPPERSAPPLRLDAGCPAGPAGPDFRTVSPRETADRLGRLVSPLTGIVGAVASDPDLAGLAHGFQASLHFLLHPDGCAFRNTGMRFVSAGKGCSEAEARASLLGEAVERYSGLFHGDEPRIAATLASLGEDAIHPARCLLFSRDQYRGRARLNARSSKFNRIPEPFADEGRELEWSPVWSLTHRVIRYLPTQYLYYCYVHPDGRRDPVWFPACSNGCAAGNTIEEAVLHGFLELVERDSVALWWYNRLRRPAVDLASFGRPGVTDLIAAYRRIGREVWALDLTSDMEIPAVAALSAGSGPSGQRVAFGFGCHPDAGIALQRALDEMNQVFSIGRKAFRERPGGGLDPDAEGRAIFSIGDESTYRWWQHATRESAPYLAPAEGLPPKTAGDYPGPAGADLVDTIARCEALVRRRGLEMLVLDQTRAGLGLRVARVIVPGLRHFWARLAPGRLYDVPVQMGWLEAPRTEAEMNPIAVFI